MLEGLDQVDWESLTHINNRPANDVPELIRRISKYDTEAMLQLFGDDNPPGYDIENVTPYIIPFVLEMIDEGDVEVRSAMLDILARLIDACKFGLTIEAERHIYIPRFEHAKLCVKTYEEISKGIFLYKNNLTNSIHRRTKMDAAELLSHFTEQGSAIADYFCDHIRTETDDIVVASILDNLGILITHTPEFRFNNVSKREKFLTFLINLIEENRSNIVNVSCALCAVYIAREWVDYNPLDLPPIVIRILQEEVKRLFAGGEQLHSPSYGFGYVIRYLAIASTDELFVFLKSNDHKFEDAYSIVVELMNIHFRNRFGALYGKWIFINEQKRIVEYLIEYEQFWQKPSDLLSSLYQLPNSPEELRKVIAESVR